jgi:hypothetical protein
MSQDGMRGAIRRTLFLTSAFGLAAVARSIRARLALLTSIFCTSMPLRLSTGFWKRGVRAMLLPAQSIDVARQPNGSWLVDVVALSGPNVK